MGAAFHLSFGGSCPDKRAHLTRWFGQRGRDHAAHIIHILEARPALYVDWLYLEKPEHATYHPTSS